MIKIGPQDVQAMFLGNMGIKSAYIGATKVYERPGAFVYIRLQTNSAQGEQTEQN